MIDLMAWDRRLQASVQRGLDMKDLRNLKKMTIHDVTKQATHAHEKAGESQPYSERNMSFPRNRWRRISTGLIPRGWTFWSRRAHLSTTRYTVITLELLGGHPQV